jgi:hypothetical protein
MTGYRRIWLIAELSASVRAVMGQLAAIVPHLYAGKAQVRTLQRRTSVRAERVKELILDGLRRSAVTQVHAYVRKTESRRDRALRARQPSER